MTTTRELEVARDLWTQARRAAVYEHRALSLLIAARKDTVENYDSVHLERAIRKGTSHYRKQLAHHIARVQATLEHLDKMTVNFDTMQAQWQESERSRLAPRAEVPVLYPVTVVRLGPEHSWRADSSPPTSFRK